MRPKKSAGESSDDLFRVRLGQIIDMGHELVRLAKRAALMAGRYTYAKQFKRAGRELRFVLHANAVPSAVGYDFPLILNSLKMLLRPILAALFAKIMPAPTLKRAA
ncbi:MAG: hypothetical protein P8Z76_21000 [Alphaproteobacteria bacterium]